MKASSQFFVCKRDSLISWLVNCAQSQSQSLSVGVSVWDCGGVCRFVRAGAILRHSSVRIVGIATKLAQRATKAKAKVKVKAKNFTAYQAPSIAAPNLQPIHLATSQ